MPVIRIALILVVLVAPTLFALQNLSPTLPLFFLGIQTQALPLAVWVVVAIAAGALTTLLLTGLFRLSNFTTERQLRGRYTRAARSRPTSSGSTSGPTPPSSTGATYQSASTYSSQTRYTEPATDDDILDDWEEEPVDRPPPAEKVYRDPTTYEVPQEPQARTQSGSVYSYSYRDSDRSGVGRTESVYDAEYRVITPPQRPIDDVEPANPPPYRPRNDHDVEEDDWDSPANPDDDWDFEDDDDFEDEDRSDRSRRW